MAGAVFSGEKKLSKAGDMLADDAPLEVRGKDHPWVSRCHSRALHHPIELFGHHVAQRLELGGDGRAGEPEHPGKETEAEDNRQQQAPWPRNRKQSANEARAAVE